MSCHHGYGPWHHCGSWPAYAYGACCDHGPAYEPVPRYRPRRRDRSADLEEYLGDLEEEVKAVRAELEALRREREVNA